MSNNWINEELIIQFSETRRIHYYEIINSENNPLHKYTKTYN